MRTYRINKDWKITIPKKIRDLEGWVAGTVLQLTPTDFGYFIRAKEIVEKAMK